MVPLTPEKLPDLNGRSAFLAAGKSDYMVPAENTERLATLLRDAGADVQLHWSPGGHELTRGDIAAAGAWLSKATGEA